MRSSILRWYRGLLLLSALAGFSIAQALEPSRPQSADRGRIQVVEIPDAESPAHYLKVLRTDADTPLRAGTAWLWSQDPMEQPASYYAALRDAGLNAVRLVLFDVWIHEEGYAKYDWQDPDYRSTMLKRIERAVNHCSDHGIYAIINAHNRVPSPASKFDETLNRNLWEVVAPHFARRTHVIYELSNEAIVGPGRDGHLEGSASETLAALVRIHDLARHLAPDTHLMVLTPAGISGYGTTTAMSNLARNFENLVTKGHIDWSKTSVAYHLYHADTNLFPRAENLRQFHRDFPGWPSENNFPPGFPSEKLGIPVHDRERSAQFGEDEFTLQTCERFGLGWSQWHINGAEQFARNWPILWADAKTKGYSWEPDHQISARRKAQKR